MKKDIYQIITEQVIKGLEEGGHKWFQSWAGNTDTMTISHTTGKIYKGINQMLLSMSMYFNEYSSREFITFNQAKKLGGKVKKGSVSDIVVKYNVSYYVNDKIKEGKRIYLKTDELNMPIIPKGYTQKDVNKSMSVRYFRVFNLDCVEGVEDKHNIDDVIKGSVFEPIKEADLVYSNMRKKPTLEHRDNIGCYYKPSQHLINMSSQDTFISSDDYYKVLFHELTHSTGHKDLLNRKTLNTTNANKTAYSQEELVAELGAMFLTNILGLEPKDSEKNSQAYINGWIKHLKNNPREIVYASGQSQKAVEYILNK
jgi:antirestriction protein ArdC